MSACTQLLDAQNPALRASTRESRDISHGAPAIAFSIGCLLLSAASEEVGSRLAAGLLHCIPGFHFGKHQLAGPRWCSAAVWELDETLERRESHWDAAIDCSRGIDLWSELTADR